MNEMNWHEWAEEALREDLETTRPTTEPAAEDKASDASAKPQEVAKAEEEAGTRDQVAENAAIEQVDPVGEKLDDEGQPSADVGDVEFPNPMPPDEMRGHLPGMNEDEGPPVATDGEPVVDIRPDGEIPDMGAEAPEVAQEPPVVAEDADLGMSTVRPSESEHGLSEDIPVVEQQEEPDWAMPLPEVRDESPPSDPEYFPEPYKFDIERDLDVPDQIAGVEVTEVASPEQLTSSIEWAEDYIPEDFLQSVDDRAGELPGDEDPQVDATSAEDALLAERRFVQ